MPERRPWASVGPAVAKAMRCFWSPEPAADVCFFNSVRTRASGRWNLLALVQRFYEPTSWRVLL